MTPTTAALAAASPEPAGVVELLPGLLKKLENKVSSDKRSLLEDVLFPKTGDAVLFAAGTRLFHMVASTLVALA